MRGESLAEGGQHVGRSALVGHLQARIPGSWCGTGEHISTSQLNKSLSQPLDLGRAPSPCQLPAIQPLECHSAAAKPVLGRPRRLSITWHVCSGYLGAHEEGEEVGCLGGILQGQAPEGALLGVQCSAPQLRWHHLPQALHGAAQVRHATRRALQLLRVRARMAQCIELSWAVLGQQVRSGDAHSCLRIWHPRPVPTAIIKPDRTARSSQTQGTPYALPPCRARADAGRHC